VPTDNFYKKSRKMEAMYTLVYVATSYTQAEKKKKANPDDK